MENYISKFQYKLNENGIVQSILYPLKTIINQENISKTLLGGSLHLDTENTRFEGLGIPVGLYLSKKNRGEIENIHKPKNANKDMQGECAVISDEDFNRLIEKISKKSRAKTLKLRELGVKKTKRNREI